MKLLKKLVLLLLILLPVVVIGGGIFEFIKALIYCLSLEYSIYNTSDRAQEIWTWWQKAGAPYPLVIRQTNSSFVLVLRSNRYVSLGDSKSVKVDTNLYRVQGKVYHGLLLFAEERFKNEGVVVLTKEGDILWIRKKLPPRVVRERCK